MKGRKGIWFDYKPPKEDEKIVIKTPEFDGVINEIITGSIFVIKNQITKESERISLTNIKAPKISRKFEKEKSDEWGYEAFEHMRKNFIGKKVRVKIDEIKKIKNKDDEEMVITNASITYDNQPIALGLLEKGLAIFKQPRMNDVASEFIQLYAESQNKALSNHVGIHSSKSSVFPMYQDLTG